MFCYETARAWIIEETVSVQLVGYYQKKKKKTTTTIVDGELFHEITFSLSYFLPCLESLGTAYNK